jgi:hypothetical protein
MCECDEYHADKSFCQHELPAHREYVIKGSMYFTSSELREQARFIDRSLEDAAAVLEKPSAQKLLSPELHGMVSGLLSKVVPLTHQDGVLALPADADPDAIPVFAAGAGKSLRVHGDVRMPSGEQYEAARTVLEEWGGSDTGAMDAVQQAVDDDTRGAATADFVTDTLFTAQVFSVDPVFHRSMLQPYLEAMPPNATLIRFIGRPVLLLGVRQGKKRAEPDVVVHELVHTHQKTKRPIEWYGSQEDVDMWSLRDELEAYHIGSLVRLAIDGVGRVQSEVNKMMAGTMEVNNRYNQVVIDWARKKYGPRIPGDPYRATPDMYRTFKTLGAIGELIHNRIDYEAVLSSIES